MCDDVCVQYPRACCKININQVVILIFPHKFGRFFHAQDPFTSLRISSFTP